MATRPFKRIYSADDLRTTADHLGSRFFSPDNMRLFRSRLLSSVAPVTPFSDPERVPVEVVYFVTSERISYSDGDSPRFYSVRRFQVGPSEKDPSQDVTRFDTIAYTATAREAARLVEPFADTERTSGIPDVARLAFSVSDMPGWGPENPSQAGYLYIDGTRFYKENVVSYDFENGE